MGRLNPLHRAGCPNFVQCSDFQRSVPVLRSAWQAIEKLRLRRVGTGIEAEAKR